MEFITYNIIDIKTKYPKLFETIKEYHPLEIKKNEEDYISFRGLKLLNNIIESNIISPKGFQDKWEKGFLDKLSDVINYNVIGATYGIVPNVGARIILEKNKDSSLELIFFVSLIKNYYSIQIVKVCEIEYYNDCLKILKRGKGIKEIYVSPPNNQYGNLFNKIDDFISNQLKGAKFLPFRFDLIRIENFQVFYKDSVDYNTVSDAFFHKGFFFDSNCLIFGDIDYKILDLE